MPGCLPSLPRRRRGMFRFLRGGNESFRSLVQKHAFHKIRRRLEDRSSATQNSLWMYKELHHQSPLHFILPHRPPLAVVELILLHMAEYSHVPEEALDSDGRTPLHVASSHNCSIDVIERLLTGVSLVVPALTKDGLDRYPLHWACCYPSLPGRTELENKYDTILILLSANPQAVNMADAEGRTPLDYARHRALDKRVTDVLSRASRKQREQENGLPKDFRRSSSVLTETNSSLMEVPSEVNASRNSSYYSQYFATRFFRRKDSMDDDVSSLGWDRASSVGHSHSPPRVPSLERRPLNKSPQINSLLSIPDTSEERPGLFRSMSLGKGTIEECSSFCEEPAVPIVEVAGWTMAPDSFD